MSTSRYRVAGTMTISCFVDVDAETPEQAKELAVDAPVMSLCHFCSDNGNHGAGVWVTSGELDGDPRLADDEVPIDLGAPRSRR